MNRSLRFLAAVVALAVVTCNVSRARAQPDTASVRFKVFDANDPTKELVPEIAVAFLRNLANNQPEFVPRVRVEKEDASGFFRVTLPKHRLVEQLVVTIHSGSGTNYNPAVISKVVTEDQMLIYPGASDPEEKFGVQAYNAQLATYRTLLAQLVDQFGESERERMQRIVQLHFGEQLLKMARAESEGRLVGFSEKQLASSREVMREVLVSYGLAKEAPSQPLQDAIPRQTASRACWPTTGAVGRCGLRVQRAHGRVFCNRWRP